MTSPRISAPPGLGAWLEGTEDSAPTTSNLHSGDLAFQRWYRFKEAFSPAFVSDIVSSLGFQPHTCTDPFAGSGTTALTCQFLGVSPTTIEVNPFLADLAEAKLSSYDIDSLIRARGILANQLRRDRNRDSGASFADGVFPGAPSTFVEPGDGNRWIFGSAIAHRIAVYRDAIQRLPDEAHRRLFRVLLGAVLVPVSNVVISGKGRRYRRPSAMDKMSAGDVDRLFEEGFQRALFDVCRYGHRRCSDYSLLRGDARKRLSECAETDLVLFSPPYPNSFDYTDIYNVELWALGYLDSANSNRALRESTLRSHVQIKRDFSTGPLPSRTLERTMRQLNEQRDDMWDPHIPDMVQAYAADMFTVLRAVRTIISHRGRVVVVVGDSRYAGIKVDVAQILAELAGDLGLECKGRHEVRAMRASAQQGGELSLGEWLLTFAQV